MPPRCYQKGSSAIKETAGHMDKSRSDITILCANIPDLYYDKIYEMHFATKNVTYTSWHHLKNEWMKYKSISNTLSNLPRLHCSCGTGLASSQTYPDLDVQNCSLGRFWGLDFSMVSACLLAWKVLAVPRTTKSFLTSKFSKYYQNLRIHWHSWLFASSLADQLSHILICWSIHTHYTHIYQKTWIYSA